MSPPKETVMAAIGGWPLALEAIISKELNDIQSVGLKVHFVFSGLDYGIKDDPFGPSVASWNTIAKGFDLYEKNLATEAIEVFKEAGQQFVYIGTNNGTNLFQGVPTPSMLSEFLKMVLHKHRIEFTVAPYSALAQVYLLPALGNMGLIQDTACLLRKRPEPVH